jgi:tetraacyldisaccharide 4'-kinase
MVKKRSIFLYPFSLIYGLITGIRNFLYDSNLLASYEFNLPLICVGNITVGGTGKTPHTEYLINLLNEKHRIATLSRGYKRKSKGFLIASPASAVKDIGDEPLQIYRKFPDITVAVDKNRVHGVNYILKNRPETSVIILDDGFQHRRIKPGLTLLLSDFERFMMKDHLLPYGNLRESLDNIRRADVILITKSPENISPIERRLVVKDIEKAPYQKLFFTSLKYKNPVPLFGGAGDEVFANDSLKKDISIVLVTGIANPQPLKEFVENSYGEVSHIDFHDHHKFTEEDLGKIFTSWDNLKSDHKYIFTTEKDAVRIQEFTNIAEPYRSSFFYIPVGIYFLNGDQEEFDNLIIEYVRKNKRNNRVSEIQGNK